MITKIVKRDGREVPFNIEKIANAIFKAAQAVGGSDYDVAMELACEVSEKIEEITKPLAYVLSHQNAFAPTTQYQLIHVRSDDDTLSLTKSVTLALDLDQLKFNGELQEKGLLAQAFDLRGEPGITLADHCREEKVGLIVMGSHGYGRIRSALMGSMVRRVASLSPIPLLIVR